MATSDMDVLKEFPVYKAILKAVLKAQIQQLVEQLASTTDEECVILTASLTDGSLSHLGSDFGKCFIEDNEDIKSQFLSFCLKRHYIGKQQENGQRKAKTSEASIQDKPVDRNVRSPRSGSLQISPNRSKDSLSVRFKPYPMTRSMRSAITLDTACEHSQSHVIKVEPNDENEICYLSERDKPSTPATVYSAANSKVSVNDYVAQQTTQSLVDPETDNTFDETLPCLSVKLEDIAKTLKTFAEHDSELGNNDIESMGIVLETCQENMSVEPVGIIHETQPDIMGVEPMKNVPDALQGPTRVEPLRVLPPIPKVHNGLLDMEFANGNQEGMCQTRTNSFCDNSEQSFQSNTAVQTHASIHTVTKTVICNKCGKVFDDSNNSDDTTVTSENHTIVKPFQCEKCFRASSVDKEFNRHNSKKNEKNQHECDQCGKCFPCKSLLNIHLAIHAGIKPFKCDMCAKSFTRKSHLTRHLATHYGIKPFKCDICGKSFTQKDDLTKHLAIHSVVKPVKCDTCGKSFTRKRNLTAHLARHLGIKPFKCDICGKSFTRKDYLRTHLARHSGIRPFKCGKSETTFQD